MATLGGAISLFCRDASMYAKWLWLGKALWVADRQAMSFDTLGGLTLIIARIDAA